MEPFTIVVGCEALLGAILGLSSRLRTFARDFGEASRDVASVREELRSLRVVLEMLQEEVQDACAGIIPDSVASQISGVISSCNILFDQISGIVAKYDGGGLKKKLSWIDHGRSEMQNFLLSLQRHRAALDLALSTINLSISRRTNDNTNQILGDTSRIRQGTDEILDLLRNLETLRSTHIDMQGTFLMERFLDSLSSYAQSSMDPDEISTSMSETFHEDEPFTAQQNNPESPPNPFLDLPTSTNFVRRSGGGNDAPMRLSEPPRNQGELTTASCNAPWHAMENFGPHNPSIASPNFEAPDSVSSDGQVSEAHPSLTSTVRCADSPFSTESSKPPLDQKQQGDSREFEITTPPGGSTVTTEETPTLNASSSSLCEQFECVSVSPRLHEDGVTRPELAAIKGAFSGEITISETLQEGGTEMPRPADMPRGSSMETTNRNARFSNSFKDEVAIMRARRSRATLSSLDRINIDRTLRQINSATKVEEVLTMLQRGADPNGNLEIYQRADNDICAPALYHSVIHGNIACIEVLLKFGAEPNCGSHDRKPLHIAIRNSNIQAASLLLRAGADVSPAVVDLAASTKNVGMVEFVLEHGATPDTSNLAKAASCAQFDLIRLLLKHGASPNSSVLDVVASQEHVDVEMVRFLLEKGVIPESSTLERAVSKRQTELVRLLLMYDAKPSPWILYIAVSQSEMEITELLLNHGAIPDNSTLDRAASKARVDIVRLLLEHGTTPGPSTMLELVKALRKVRSNKLAQQVVSLLGLLFDYGINEWSESPAASWEDVLHATIHIRPFSHLNDLHLTHLLRKVQYETLQRLLDQGVDVNSARSCNAYRPTHAPLECAIRRLEREGAGDIIALLLEYGANAKGGDGSVAPLDLAADRGSAEIMHLLLRAGAECGLQSIPSHLEIAVRYNGVEAVDLLLAIANGSL